MVYLDEMKTKELEAVKELNKVFARQLVSHQKQLKKLFAISTEKMRAFCIRGVHESQCEWKEWDRGKSHVSSI